MESLDEEVEDLNLSLKVCVINKACGLETEKDGVKIKFECDGAKKLVAGLVALAAFASAM